MSEPFVGEIRMFGFNFAPRGWASCDGQLLAISQNDALFALLGTIYGGDGRTTFALPDLRGRVPLHEGTGPGLSPYRIGQKAGSETVTLTGQQTPAHGHAAQATTGAATSTALNNLMPATVSGDTMYATDVTGLTPFTAAAQSIGSNAGGQAHDNLMPTLTAHFCIALFGIFPSRQ
jgi:microcystin-dependent protein